MLRVQAAFAETGVDRPLVAAELADELRLMADWMELDDVAVADRGDLAADLARRRSGSALSGRGRSRSGGRPRERPPDAGRRRPTG